MSDRALAYWQQISSRTNTHTHKNTHILVFLSSCTAPDDIYPLMPNLLPYMQRLNITLSLSHSWHDVVWVHEWCRRVCVCECAFCMQLCVHDGDRRGESADGNSDIGMSSDTPGLTLLSLLNTYSHGKHKPIESVQTVMRSHPTTIGWIRLSAEHRREQTTQLPFMGIQSQNPFSVLSTINLFLEPRTWTGQATEQHNAPHNAWPHREEPHRRFLEKKTKNNKGK